MNFKENPTKTRQHGLHPNPRMTNPKMFAIGGDRCPVEIFDFFVSKRPADMKNSGRFYLYPKMHCTTTENWFKVSPVGKNKIAIQEIKRSSDICLIAFRSQIQR